MNASKQPLADELTTTAGRGDGQLVVQVDEKGVTAEVVDVEEDGALQLVKLQMADAQGDVIHGEARFTAGDVLDRVKSERKESGNMALAEFLSRVQRTIVSMAASVLV